jgi:hypothetical protein
VVEPCEVTTVAEETFVVADDGALPFMLLAGVGKTDSAEAFVVSMEDDFSVVATVICDGLVGVCGC